MSLVDKIDWYVDWTSMAPLKIGDAITLTNPCSEILLTPHGDPAGFEAPEGSYHLEKSELNKLLMSATIPFAVEKWWLAPNLQYDVATGMISCHPSDKAKLQKQTLKDKVKPGEKLTYDVMKDYYLIQSANAASPKITGVTASYVIMDEIGTATKEPEPPENVLARFRLKPKLSKPKNPYAFVKNEVDKKAEKQAAMLAGLEGSKTPAEAGTSSYGWSGAGGMGGGAGVAPDSVLMRLDLPDGKTLTAMVDSQLLAMSSDPKGVLLVQFAMMLEKAGY